MSKYVFTMMFCLAVIGIGVFLLLKNHPLAGGLIMGVGCLFSLLTGDPE